MRVTRAVVAEKLSDYLSHRINLAQLVDWAEEAMQEAELEEQHLEAIRDVLARLGLANVRAFGLTWEECEASLHRLGYHAQVEVMAGAGGAARGRARGGYDVASARSTARANGSG